jgi:pimeloyl-ACP methyl ester carboxylesterase
MQLFKVLAPALLIPLATASTSVCSDVSFQISATSQNIDFLSPPDPNNATAIVDFFYVGLTNGTGPAVKGTNSVSGNFTINGVYCRPSNGCDTDVLEVLVHGISYNKSIWSGLGLSNTYNWQSYASSKGYSTLAIDRLGHGTNPQRPDPLNVIQGYMHIEIIHQLINAIRTNSKNSLGRSFDTVVYVSHSYGGWIGTGLIASYPNDVDAVVLTGWSASVDLTPFAATQLESAALVNPKRFPGLQLGYITVEEETQRTSLFYAGGFKKQVAARDYALEDTWTIGETGNLGFVVSPTHYTGPLYLATGVQDVLFCQTPIATCETILNDTRQLFPGVTEFGYTAINNTGHSLMLHDSAQQTFDAVHTFLNRVLL